MCRITRIDPETSRANAMLDAVPPMTLMTIPPENLPCPGRSDRAKAGNAEGSGPAGSLTPVQERQLAELMGRWWEARDSGNTLPPVVQDELEALARAWLRGSATDESGW